MMKKNNYIAPDLTLVMISSKDIMSASKGDIRDPHEDDIFVDEE